ncbi:outer membrane efflux family protein, putative [Salinibacter ruber DSM 13855]|uniref:Outer membrane efflux family protein, putative n=1 Tax=Salinibacter ruber (strain DSM 13855 / M31) TaxID=309807 RepID=Q2S143_SALRD|nr:TolC family protein [Salinibacter ruber]ABC45102.1 outer membrane efflux family protein, putative [Salinibacter ruber DSM 13855]
MYFPVVSERSLTSGPRIGGALWILMFGIIALLPVRGAAQPAAVVDDDTSATLSLSLDETLARAQEESFPARSAEATRRAATARKRQSLGVFLPRITAREQGLFTTDPVNAFGSKLRQERFAQQDLQLGALNTPDRVDQYGTQLEIEQPILNLDGIFERRAASDAARAAGHKAERTEAIVAFRAKKGYYGLLLAERRVGVIDSALAAARATRDQAQALFEEGIINRADRLAAAVRVSELESRRSEAVARRDNAADQLRVLIGLEDDVRIEPTDSLTRESALVGDVSLDAVNQRRSDMQALRARAEAARQKTRSRWLAFVPTLNARGTTGWYDDTPFGTNGQSWTAGVSLSWSLFEGYQQIGRAQEAEAQQQRAEIALEQQALENDVEITSARRDLRAAQERIDQARTAVAQAEESLRIRSDRYAEGMARTTDLLQAEATLAERRLAYLRALYQHNITVYRLELLTEQSMTR